MSQSASSAPRWWAIGGAVCAITSLAGLLVSPARFWVGYLIGFQILTGLAIAGPMFLAFLYISGARWSRSLESLGRAIGAALPAAAAAGVVLLVGVPTLYEWSHSAAVESDHILQAKSAFLNVGFFAARTVAYFVLWWLLARVVFAAAEQRADEDATAHRRRRMRAGALFLLVFAPTWSLAGIDWVQSLEPHWFSAIFALRTLSGVALAGVAAATLLALLADARGVLPARLSDNQVGDLGALTVSFALFWGYIWYSQYMLIWYTNLPEETGWYVARHSGGWGVMAKTSLVVNCAIPFVVLLFRRARRSRFVMARLAVLLLVGRVLDLYVLAGPPLMGEEPRLGAFEFAPIVLMTGAFAWFATRALGTTKRDGGKTDSQSPDDSAPSGHPSESSAREPATAIS